MLASLSRFSAAGKQAIPRMKQLDMYYRKERIMFGRKKRASRGFVPEKDEMTGLKNRSALRRDMDSYLGRQLVVCMLAIDQLKDINARYSRYGSMIGDLVLQGIAENVPQSQPEDLQAPRDESPVLQEQMEGGIS